MKKLLQTICEEEGYKEPSNKSGITLELLLEGALTTNIVKYVVEKTGCNKNTVTRALANAFPDRDTIHDRSLSKFLLYKWELASCSACGETKDLKEFYYNQNKTSGYSDICKECNKEYRKNTYYKDPQKEIHLNSVRKRMRDTKQTPSWACLDTIANFYKNRPEGYHVDHIEPLNGVNVCGLHVIENLQYLTAFENLSKGNR